MLPSPRRSPRGGSSPYLLPPRPFPARGSAVAAPSPRSNGVSAVPASAPPSADEQWAELERAAAAFREAPPAPAQRSQEPEAVRAPSLPPLPPAGASAGGSVGGRTPRTPRSPRVRMSQVVPLATGVADGDDDAPERKNGPALPQAAPPAAPATPAPPRGDGASAHAALLHRMAPAGDAAERDGELHTARDALFAAQLAPRWPGARVLPGGDDPAARESAWVRALLALRRPARAVAADAARAALLGAYLLTGAAVAFAALYRVDGATKRVVPL